MWKVRSRGAIVGTGSGANATASPTIARRRNEIRFVIGLRDVGGPVFGIGRVDHHPRLLGAFSFPRHTHHILGYVHTNGTAKGMIVISDLAIRGHIRHIAIVIGSMADVTASAITGDIPHDVGIGDIKLVGFPHRDRRVLNIHWHLVQ